MTESRQQISQFIDSSLGIYLSYTAYFHHYLLLLLLENPYLVNISHINFIKSSCRLINRVYYSSLLTR